MKSLVVLIALSGSLLAQSQIKTRFAEIQGTVTSRDGAPVPNATVYAVSQDLRFDDLPPVFVQADRNGAFDFRGKLALGCYKLYSRMSDSPDPFDSFFADATVQTPKILLTSSHPSARVTVQTAPRAAIVTGRILDADTGAAVKAYLEMLDSEGHGYSVLVNGTYRILLPPGKDVMLMVTLAGEHEARPIMPTAPLRLEPGQFVAMDFSIAQR
ncbi:MAG TPA: carboxypeptidase-like regulatory domain-containing protein [Candidatus Sulfotelmatobacter sp.]|nr:carboxypeptidase-like regulatory domain-containing protein [Candidatus Sulfotelmatobacter sp.]HEV3513141.1 carboxypeptidase-like regulatory domain-containing protein [Candidatus Sulfotelmatobacter sp.]